MNANGSVSTESLSTQAPRDGESDARPAVDLLAVTLAAYAEVLGIGQVLPDDDFFTLGGDSMLAIEAVSIIETAIGTEISPALFFTYPTAAEFASVLAEAGPGE